MDTCFLQVLKPGLIPVSLLESKPGLAIVNQLADTGKRSSSHLESLLLEPRCLLGSIPPRGMLFQAKRPRRIFVLLSRYIRHHSLRITHTEPSLGPCYILYSVPHSLVCSPFNGNTATACMWRANMRGAASVKSMKTYCLLAERTGHVDKRLNDSAYINILATQWPPVLHHRMTIWWLYCPWGFRPGIFHIFGSEEYTATKGKHVLFCKSQDGYDVSNHSEYYYYWLPYTVCQNSMWIKLYFEINYFKITYFTSRLCYTQPKPRFWPAANTIWIIIQVHSRSTNLSSSRYLALLPFIGLSSRGDPSAHHPR